MRYFSTATAAHALGVNAKFLDNLLVRHAVPLVATGRQGKSRRISFAILEQIAVALVLNRDLGASLAKSCELAAAIAASPTKEVPIGTLGILRLDLAGLSLPLEEAIDIALEEVAPPRRGRPPSESARG